MVLCQTDLTYTIFIIQIVTIANIIISLKVKIFSPQVPLRGQVRVCGRVLEMEGPFLLKHIKEIELIAMEVEDGINL